MVFMAATLADRPAAQSFAMTSKSLFGTATLYLVSFLSDRA
jgi:hypothetical protein